VSIAQPAARLSLHDQATVFLVGVGHGVTHWLKMAVFILLPAVREDFGLSYADIGLFGTVYYVGGALTNATCGPLADLTGRRELFQVLAIVVLIVAVAGIGVTETYWVFCAMAVLIAASNSLWHPAAIPYLANRYDRHRGYVLSIHSLFSNIGDSVAPAIVGAMVSGWFLIEFTWRETVLLNTLPAVLILSLLFIFLLRRNGNGAHPPETGMSLRRYMEGLRSQLRSRVVVGLAVVAGLRSTAQGGLRLFLPLYLTDAMGLPIAVAGVGLMALNIGGMVAAVPAGVISDRYGRRPITMLALGLSSVLIVGLTVLENELALVIGISLVGFSILALRPVLISWMMDVMPSEMRGTGTYLMHATQSLFNTAAPALAGLIASVYGLAAVFYFFAAMLLLANVVAFLLPKETPRIG
jgi:MFS family permease